MDFQGICKYGTDISYDLRSCCLLCFDLKLTKKKPRFGALPTLNMPKKSHETAKPPPRPCRSVVKDLEPSSSSVYYKTFNELCQRVKGLKTLSEWSYKIFSETCYQKARRTLHAARAGDHNRRESRLY